VVKKWKDFVLWTTNMSTMGAETEEWYLGDEEAISQRRRT
jgi:hypothetical protein